MNECDVEGPPLEVSLVVSATYSILLNHDSPLRKIPMRHFHLVSSEDVAKMLAKDLGRALYCSPHICRTEVCGTGLKIYNYQ